MPRNIFTNSDEKTRRVIFFARYEALIRRATEIKPVHLLIGFIRENKTLIEELIGKEETVNFIRFIQERHGSGDNMIPDLQIPLSEETKNILNKALEISREEECNTEARHILMALVEIESDAKTLLSEVGISKEKVWEFFEITQEKIQSKLELEKNKAQERKNNFFNLVNNTEITRKSWVKYLETEIFHTKEEIQDDKDLEEI